MDFYDSRFYRWLDLGANFLLLNLVWGILCLPLVSAPPATAALFGVVREWQRDQDTGVFGLFFQRLRDNLTQSLVIGLLWVLIGSTLALLYVAASQSPETLQFVLFVLTTVCAFVYASASVYVFPLMVNYHLTSRQLVAYATLLSLSHIGTTLLCLLIIGTAIVCLLLLPLSVLASGSLTAYLIHLLCRRVFVRIETLRRLDLRRHKKP